MRANLAAILLMGLGFSCAALPPTGRAQAEPAASGGEERFQLVVDFRDAASLRRFTDRVPHRDLLSISRHTGPFIRGLCRTLEGLAEARAHRTAKAGSITLARLRPGSAACPSDVPLITAFARRVCRAMGMVVIAVEGMRITCRLPGML